MKKKALFSSLIGLAAIITPATLSLTSCSSDDEVQLEEQTKKISDFDLYGNLHNYCLSSIKTDFNADSIKQYITTKEEALKRIAEFQISLLENSGFFNDDKHLLRKNFESYMDFYEESYVRKVCTSHLSRAEEIPDSLLHHYAKNELEICKNKNILNKFEYDIINELINCVEANIDGINSMDNIEAIVDSLIIEWEKQKFPKQELIGNTSGVVLNISKASTSYWEKEDNTTMSRAPHALVADFYGAICGALECAIAGDLSFKGVCRSGLVSATAASTGLWGKIRRFLGF